jgi:hypothetical protein
MIRGGMPLNTGIGRVRIFLGNQLFYLECNQDGRRGGHMKRVTLLAILGVLAVFVGCTSMQSSKVVLRIPKEELKAKLGSPDLVLLDVRATNDWKESGEKITGAQRVDPETIDTWAATLPKGKEIVLYCT